MVDPRCVVLFFCPSSHLNFHILIRSRPPADIFRIRDRGDGRGSSNGRYPIARPALPPTQPSRPPAHPHGEPCSWPACRSLQQEAASPARPSSPCVDTTHPYPHRSSPKATPLELVPAPCRWAKSATPIGDAGCSRASKNAGSCCHSGIHPSCPLAGQAPPVLPAGPPSPARTRVPRSYEPPQHPQGVHTGCTFFCSLPLNHSLNLATNSRLARSARSTIRLAPR